ncbi:hypothetical protein L6164_012243 [Bauhinia variegata]|uniref:Uncharacterized protein n=1 Tax=Bauhinia variegata TaxID=167791 RepID=A0ACB9PAM7_BAUVA|nr:hypothetical protein L6164_012243 [Bauhinia variegata]
MDSTSDQPDFDYLFKLLIIGDSGVGKSSLLLSFTSDNFEDISPTIGIFFSSSGSNNIDLSFGNFSILEMNHVYDVTRRETFTNLSEVWAKEIDLYSTNQDCIKMLVGNKVDKEGDRVVTKKEGIEFAREYGCLFIECSAKTRVNVQQCFEELVLKILDTPSLLAEGSKGVKKNIFKEKPPQPGAATSSCC